YGLNAVKLCVDADVKKHVITKPSNTSAANNSTVDQGLSNTAMEYKCSADGGGEEGMLNKSPSRLLACFNWSSLDGKCRVVSSTTMQTLGITQHNRHVEIFFTNFHRLLDYDAVV
ncbi:hypothetical protein Tco_1223488, partial [Tanacetum coccineum]